MKKLINRPERVVEEMLEGLLALHPGLSKLSHHKVLIRSDAEEVRHQQVAIISGGGSGHEPAHAGFVGPGMLSAAVAGEIFTSPSAESVLAAIRAVAGEPGVLLIVKNYTGDRINFGLAAEMARSEGVLVETVVVADDVALASTQENAGRRGIAGTVLVHKIAGAAAADGKDLPQVASIAQAAIENVGTMGVSLSAGVSPTVGKPSFTLDDEVELGLGIHGEPGVRRVPSLPADDLVDQLLNQIIPALRLRKGERVAALINNLGATTGMELAIVGRRMLAVLESQEIAVERIYAGTFVSSLDMAGVSISLMRLDHERLKWLDRDTAAPAWPRALAASPGSVAARIIDSEPVRLSREASPPQTSEGRAMERAVRAACDALLEASTSLTEMDQIVGDGDLGLNMARMAEAVRAELLEHSLDQPAEALKELGHTVQELLGGSSGPFYGAFLLRAGSVLGNGPADDPKLWAFALTEGCGAISELGGATLGDRTMLDALVPFAHAFQRALGDGSSVSESLEMGVQAAEAGARRTAEMTARRGRSSYLGERAIGHMDPGAVAVAIVLRAVSSAFAE